MATITRNEIIGDSKKLKITLQDNLGSPIIPTELYFALFEINSPEKVLVPIRMFPSAVEMQPVDIFTLLGSGGDKVAEGEYVARAQIPHDASLGRSKIIWYYKLAVGQAAFNEFEEEFDIIDYVAVYGSGGPPPVSINVIRTFLRDKPELHVLVDNILFTDSDILTAASCAVSRFNDIPPPLSSTTLATFPSKDLLLRGIAAFLFDSEANNQLMEQLTYQDGNIHHGISDKTSLYRQAADRYLQQFDALASEIKMQININGVYSGEGVGVRFMSSSDDYVY